MKEGVNKFFEEYLQKQPLFKNKHVLDSDYTPKIIPHRKEQIDQIAGILAPSLRKEKPSNLFIYGKTGSGKSLSVQYIAGEVLSLAEKNKISLKMIYLNCKLKRVADTEYRLIAQITRDLGEEVPPTGLPTDEVYKLFLHTLEKQNILLILVLDEIDQLLTKMGDEILYNLTRLNTELKNSKISLIGITNDLSFANNLDPRVKSSLSEEELLFPPYDAYQLQSILRQRAKLGFRNGTIEDGVIEKCAAYAAREHGDARRALALLRIAGELAERNNHNTITIQHIDLAEEKIERDRVLDSVNTQPKQFKLVLYSIFTVSQQNNGSRLFTGDLYEIYKEASFKNGVRPLTQRRVSDIIAELDMSGIINAKVISKGRYGRTREICLAIPPSTIPKLTQSLKEGLNL